MHFYNNSSVFKGIAAVAFFISDSDKHCNRKKPLCCATTSFFQSFFFSTAAAFRAIIINRISTISFDAARHKISSRCNVCGEKFKPAEADRFLHRCLDTA